MLTKLLSLVGVSLVHTVSQMVRRLSAVCGIALCMYSPAVAAAQQLVMNLILVKKNVVQHRRLFMLADLAYTLLNLFNGAVVAVVRLLLSVLFFGEWNNVGRMSMAVC